MRAVATEPSTSVQRADVVTFHCEDCVRDEMRIIPRADCQRPGCGSRIGIPVFFSRAARPSFCLAEYESI
jgi:hypothetical protein